MAKTLLGVAKDFICEQIEAAELELLIAEDGKKETINLDTQIKTEETFRRVFDDA